MAAQPPPAGWVNVPYTDAATVKTCAGLLANSTPDNSATTLNNLTALLRATYTEPLAAANLPLFFLYYNAKQNLCVAFYKTIKTGGTPTSANGIPTRRWWCITVGVAAQPAGAWSYPFVKSICTYFYYSVMNPAINDILVTAEDANRQPNPNNYEVDACSIALGNDATVTKQNPAGENGYPPWTVCLKPGNKIEFTQLSL